MENTDTDKIIYPLDKDLITVTQTTLVRLYALSADAATLYVFYCNTAKLQANRIGYTNKIKATDTYCRRGLKWGEKKFYKAKKILLDNNFIKKIIDKKAGGQVKGWYIQVNYLLKPQSSFPESGPQSSFPESGFWETNAVNKNRNAVNKKKKNPTKISSLINKSEKKTTKPPTSHSKVSYSIEKLTYDQIYKIADSRNVNFKDVARVYHNALSSIEAGNKYKIQSLSRTVPKWVDRSVRLGEILKMNEIERQVQRATLSPEGRQRIQEGIVLSKQKGLI